MKKLAIALFILAAMACEKPTIDDLPAISGKVVHRSCATIAVQVLDVPYYYLGQDNWQQAPSKPTYSYVFAVANFCSFPNTLQEGDDFKFKVINSDPNGNTCAVCTLWDNPPTKQQMIQVVTNE